MSYKKIIKINYYFDLQTDRRYLIWKIENEANFKKDAIAKAEKQGSIIFKNE